MLLHSLTDFLELVLCNVHIHTIWMNNKTQQHFLKEENSDSSLWMERAWSPLCYHDISWNFVMSVTTVLSFSSRQKKSWEVFNFLWFYTALCPLCDVIRINQQECYHNKLSAILHHYESWWDNKRNSLQRKKIEQYYDINVIWLRIEHEFYFFLSKTFPLVNPGALSDMYIMQCNVMHI